MKSEMNRKTPAATKEYEKTTLVSVGENLYRNVSSGTYYFRLIKDGKQIKRSLQTTDRAIALQRKKAMLDQVNAMADAKKLTAAILFKDFAEEYLSGFVHLKESSMRRKRDCVKNLAKTFGSSQLRKITADEIQSWYAKRVKKRSSSTTNKELEVLKAIFEKAVEIGYILSNPAKPLKKRKLAGKEIIIPSREQVGEILAALRGYDIRYHEAANLIEFLGLSGMRISEATEVRWADVDFENNLIRITGGETGTKNCEIRFIPIFPSLKEFLGRIEKRKPAETILLIDSAKKALATVCKHLKYPSFTHHSLRHYFCSNAIEAGVDFKTISSWLGHQDGGILVAKTYGHLRQDHSQRMAELMK